MMVQYMQHPKQNWQSHKKSLVSDQFFGTQSFSAHQILKLDNHIKKINTSLLSNGVSNHTSHRSFLNQGWTAEIQQAFYSLPLHNNQTPTPDLTWRVFGFPVERAPTYVQRNNPFFIFALNVHLEGLEWISKHSYRSSSSHIFMVSG